MGNFNRSLWFRLSFWRYYLLLWARAGCQPATMWKMDAVIVPASGCDTNASQRHRGTNCRVHDRDRDQIRGDVAFDLLRDFDNLALADEARHHLDEVMQEDIA
jgi:hypothetical protein